MARLGALAADDGEGTEEVSILKVRFPSFVDGREFIGSEVVEVDDIFIWH